MSADDFGLSPAINEGVERAHVGGCLSTASLMVGADAAADAIERARRLPNLKVGLHLVVIEGRARLPHDRIRHLTDATGNWFGSNQLRLGLRYAFIREVREELEAEIRAQFQAFAATGLALDHVNAHKHMHLHPVVGGMLLRIGREFGLRHVRVPTEPAIAGIERGAALRHWSMVLRRQVARAGMVTTDHCFGLAWSGDMRASRVQRLLRTLPAGSSEVYFHPAAGRDVTIDRLMPSYAHEAELATLTDEETVRLATPFASNWRQIGTGPAASVCEVGSLESLSHMRPDHDGA